MYSSCSLYIIQMKLHSGYILKKAIVMACEQILFICCYDMQVFPSRLFTGLF